MLQGQQIFDKFDFWLYEHNYSEFIIFFYLLMKLILTTYESAWYNDYYFRIL